MEYLDLPILGNRQVKINPSQYDDIKEELENFLSDKNYMKTIAFVKKILFNLEIKSNNTVEGFTDDINFIEEVIKNTGSITNDEKRKRIINLYYGYKFILNHHQINEEDLKKLYDILSEGLLCQNDLNRMGPLYRRAPVYILNKGRLDTELDQGLPYELIQQYMDKYFEFISNNQDGTMTEYFIKSQIIHFYFVYIHPYFDVNGRTSRTVAMWYLINMKAYPYLIFNRAINFAQGSYDGKILDAKYNGDISRFIEFMMVNVKKELEKEMIMGEIKENTNSKMRAMDFQALNYILSMNGDINVLTFATLYRANNGFKKVKDIYEEVLRPLIEKEILIITRTTQKYMFDEYRNEVLKINPTRYDSDNPQIKRLKIKR